MYATVHQFRREVAGESGEWARAVAADLHSVPPLGGCVLGQVAGVLGAAVAFWPDAAAAGEASARTSSIMAVALDTDVFEVVTTEALPGAPRYAQASWFAGPRDDARVRAEDFAGRERIRPVARRVPGAGPLFVLRSGDGATLVLGFAESIAAIEAVQRAVMTTELLPGEDPALLTGPDRIDLYRVCHEALPATTSPGGIR